MFLLAAQLCFAQPVPLEMPRAEAYLVTAGDRQYLEDRYERFDLWLSHCVCGRWVDEDGRVFTLAELDSVPPASTEDGTVTREDFAAALVPFDKKNRKVLASAIAMLTAAELPEKPSAPRQLPRGYADVDYYHGTATNYIICAYLKEKASVWQLAVWELAEGDAFEERLEYFEKEFLEKPKTHPEVSVPKAVKGERELLREEARHSIAAYPDWRMTDSEEFAIIDDLPSASSFRIALTNDLKRRRAEYAKAVPSPLDQTNVLAVARIYATREEYLEALAANDETNMEWTAAYWSPRRRELVAYLPQDGEAELMKTIRHEAFHQYLSYATSFLPTSPWFNEGFAQYFEEGGEGADKFAGLDKEQLEVLSKLIAPILMMDYAEFYSGTDIERRAKYRLAARLIYFLEKGAPNVRFDPFKNFKRDYLAALLRTKDPRQATNAAFGSKDNFELFVSEWKKFWLNM